MRACERLRAYIIIRLRGARAAPVSTVESSRSRQLQCSARMHAVATLRSMAKIFVVLIFLAVAVVHCKADHRRLVPRQAVPDLTCELGTFLQQFTALQDSCREALLALSGITDIVEDFPLIYQHFSTICPNADCREPVLNLARQCFVESDRNLIEIACTQNSNDIFCFQAVAFDNGTSVAENCEMLLYGNETQCNASCKSSVEAFRDSNGVCLCYVYNTTDFGLQDLQFAEYRLWSACGVETICDSAAAGLLAGHTTATILLLASLVFKLF